MVVKKSHGRALKPTLTLSDKDRKFQFRQSTCSPEDGWLQEEGNGYKEGKRRK